MTRAMRIWKDADEEDMLLGDVVALKSEGVDTRNVKLGEEEHHGLVRMTVIHITPGQTKMLCRCAWHGEKRLPLQAEYPRKALMILRDVEVG